MAFGFPKNISRPKPSPIAVDFGADALKLLQIQPGDPPQLIAAASATVPEHARHDPAAREAFLGEALNRLLKLHPFKGKRAMLSLPAFQTLVQNIQVPRCEPAELNAHVDAHLRERLGIDPGRMVTRCFPVGEVVREGGPKLEVVCIGASRQTVMQYVNLAAAAKLEVVGMHSEPPCLPLAFSQIYNRRTGDEKQVRCLIDIGSATTKVVIAEGPRMVFAKTIHAAGEHMTRALAQQRSVDYDQARALRMTPAPGSASASGSASPESAAQAAAQTGPVGAIKPTPDHDPGPSTVVEASGDAALDEAGGLAVLRAATRGSHDIHPAPPGSSPAPGSAPRAAGDVDGADGETLDCLLDELQLCARYYLAMGPGKKIDKLIFVGGEANHTPICQAIARRLRIAAQLGDPFARLMRTGENRLAPGIDLDQPQPGWSVPYGLCLSEANL